MINFTLIDKTIEFQLGPESIEFTLIDRTYETVVTPTSALSAALFYVTNKTTTTFDVTYLAGLTGTVQFDWIVRP